MYYFIYILPNDIDLNYDCVLFQYILPNYVDLNYEFVLFHIHIAKIC